MERKPTLVEYLMSEKGYSAVVTRPDGSIVARYDSNTNSWEVIATPEEIVGYRNETTEAIPKLERIARDFKPAVPRLG